MTDDPWDWVFAVWQTGTAVGIATFWLTWFRRPHDEEWLPVGYVEHERVFVFPDLVLSTLLMVSAALTVFEISLGRSLGLVAAGMLAFLGVIDLAYFAQHGMFAREREGLGNVGILVAVFAMSVALIARNA